VYCSVVWRGREQLLSALNRGNWLDWAASAVAPTRGTAEVSRCRNLGQTVDNIQDNFIHYKDISMIIIFKMFIHKQKKWKYNEHMSLFSDMVIWLKKYYIINTIL
jgi:hypothetical protein